MESTFHLGRTCVLLVKKLLVWQDISKAKQEDYLMQSHGAVAFSEELCPLVSLHHFAFWERQLHC